MKFIKHLIIVFCFLSLVKTNAQTDPHKEDYKFRTSLGINIIDDSFTKTHQLIGSDEKWNISLIPSFFGFNILLTENISVESNLSYNKYKKGVLVDGLISKEDKYYFAIDVNGKYDLSDLTWNSDALHFLKPYVFGGPGLTVIEDQSRITINYGFGTIIWVRSFDDSGSRNGFFNNLGLFLQTQGKSSIQQKKYGNQIQHSVGLIYQFN